MNQNVHPNNVQCITKAQSLPLNSKVKRKLSLTIFQHFIQFLSLRPEHSHKDCIRVIVFGLIQPVLPVFSFVSRLYLSVLIRQIRLGTWPGVPQKGWYTTRCSYSPESTLSRTSSHRLQVPVTARTSPNLREIIIMVKYDTQCTSRLCMQEPITKRLL